MALLSEPEVPPFTLHEQPEDPAEVVLPPLSAPASVAGTCDSR